MHAMTRVALRRTSPFVVLAATAVSGSPWTADSCETRCDEGTGPADSLRSPKLLFLGTGSSTGCPKPICTMLFQQKRSMHPSKDSARQQMQDFCKTSNVAIQGDPRTNRDYRNNPSLLLSHFESGERKNVVIDVGKTFRETALRWMPHHGIDSLDAVILTHHHMDAVGGLDDIRGFQSIVQTKRFMTGKGVAPPPTRVPLPVYLSQECLEQVASQFPWLFPHHHQQQQQPNSNKSTTFDKRHANKPIVQRDVAALDVHVVTNYRPFQVHGLEITPLPVLHGVDLESLGFSFSITGADGTKKHILYISDISHMIPETLEHILTKLPPTDIFIVDTLLESREHPVHFHLQQAIALSKQIRAKQTYLIGMSCDAFPPHDEMNARLSRETDNNVSFAHDGLVLYL